MRAVFLFKKHYSYKGLSPNTQEVLIEMVYQDLALCNSIDVTGNLFLGRELVKNYFGFKFLDKKKMHL